MHLFLQIIFTSCLFSNDFSSFLEFFSCVVNCFKFWCITHMQNASKKWPVIQLLFCSSKSGKQFLLWNIQEKITSILISSLETFLELLLKNLPDEIINSVLTFSWHLLNAPTETNLWIETLCTWHLENVFLCLVCRSCEGSSRAKQWNNSVHMERGFFLTIITIWVSSNMNRVQTKSSLNYCLL